MTFNVHLPLHLARSVLDRGPLFSYNAYAFESGNGNLLKVIQAVKGVHHQICRGISLKYSFLRLNNHIYLFSSFIVKYFCNTIVTITARNTLKTSSIRYFGSASRVNASWLQKLNLLEQSFLLEKNVKNGCLYISSTKNNKRSDNSYAQLQNRSYVKIHNFMVQSGAQTEYTII